MKVSDFSVKVSDLLKQPGSQDTIDFVGMQSDQIAGLSASGISGSLHLQSLDMYTIMAELENLHVDIHDTCQRCEKQFIRHLHIPVYGAKYILPGSTLDENASSDEVFPINPRTELIDTHDMVIQAVVLQQPLVIRCDVCEQEVANLPDEDEIGWFEAQSNIVFE